ncbi:MAG: hypothetical protein J6A77_05310 [Lachnospiraceae bacterium]|nr:hypothetical protein [Lachnospiraceae bacterium]
MKKRKRIAVLFLFLFLTGCSNQFAREEYNSVKHIAGQEDRYAKEDSMFNPIEGGYSFVVSRFDGRETLKTWNVQEEKELELEIIFSLTAGQGKLVHIDADGTVTTIQECTPEVSAAVVKTITLKKGQNRLRFVGYDCENIDLKMYFEEP